MGFEVFYTADATSFLSGEKATWSTRGKCSSWLCRVGVVEISQSMSVVLADPDAPNLPSGENPTASALSELPSSVCRTNPIKGPRA